jgi:hypothetical protein
MKTTRVLTVVISAIAAFFLLTSFLNHQQAQNKYLTLWTTQGGLDTKIVIVYEDGNTEEIDLDKFKPSSHTSNAKKINEAINSVANKGYELIAMSGTDLVTNTYIFVKK